MAKTLFSKSMMLVKVVAPLDFSYAKTDPASWLIEEDIEVVGFDLMGHMEEPSGNDGYTWWLAELQQDAEFGLVGSLGCVPGFEQWNTVPAFGMLQNGHMVAMFPPDARFIVREEGHLYLGLTLMCQAKTAGTTTVEAYCQIYYHKLSGRK